MTMGERRHNFCYKSSSFHDCFRSPFSCFSLASVFFLVEAAGLYSSFVLADVIRYTEFRLVLYIILFMAENFEALLIVCLMITKC